MDPSWKIIVGDCRQELAKLQAGSVHTCVTSPPYFGLRDYGHDGQIGLEPNLLEYIVGLCHVFREIKRVLRDDGTAWLNLGDSYDRDKNLIGVPWRVAQRLKQDGWYLRSDIIWAKPNPMPESVTDRPTRSHEHIFLLSKSARYFYDADAIRELSERPEMVGRINGSFGPVDRGAPPGQRAQAGAGVAETYRADRNKRDVWTVSTKPYPGAHFATFPPDLIQPCILAGCPEGGTVLDPFAGAGTTGLVAIRHNRSFVGVELNPEYAELARWRIRDDSPLFNGLLEVA